MNDQYKKSKNIYTVIISFSYNIPSITHVKTLEIEACDCWEAESKVKSMYPNITNLAVIEERGQ